MATDDETFTTCSVCSATTDLKKDNFGWDYCACIDANYCPECSPTNACECGQDGSCECANCATDDDINKLKMATYNDLPTVVTENIFTYLRHERRQPPHAYCIDKLIQSTDELMSSAAYDSTDLLAVVQGREELIDYLGSYTGNAVEFEFFYPYLQNHGWDEWTNEFDEDDYEEPQMLSWTFHKGDMTKKYDRYDKNGVMNFWHKDGPMNFSRP